VKITPYGVSLFKTELENVTELVYIYIINRKEKMIATALALQDATQDAVIDISTMIMAKSIYNSRLEMTDEEFSKALFNYSAHLASVTATLVTNAVMTETQLTELLETIQEMDSMGKDVK
jgi:hypothetical protein